MPLPRWLARFNHHVTNHILGPLAYRIPGWGIVVHAGRKTRHEYRTPVFVFRHGDRIVIALTYGRESQWVRNVISADGCGLETEGRTFRLSHPHLFHDENRHTVPAFHRRILGLFGVSDFLELTVAER
jgi:deazaflavin-dependent oxidoreductase (nitroreductase family)